MNNHTPGPWTSDGSHIYAPDGEIIAQVRNPGSKESDYPLVANRDLMTAAPDLLEALKAAVAYPCTGGWYEQAEAAIAKAEGGAK